MACWPCSANPWIRVLTLRVVTLVAVIYWVHAKSPDSRSHIQRICISASGLVPTALYFWKFLGSLGSAARRAVQVICISTGPTTDTRWDQWQNWEQGSGLPPRPGSLPFHMPIWGLLEALPGKPGLWWAHLWASVGLDSGISSIACHLAQEEPATPQLSPVTRVLVSDMVESMELPGVDLRDGCLENRPSPWPRVCLEGKKKKKKLLVED